jgi:long-chain fatty acid transport protein
MKQIVRVIGLSSCVALSLFGAGYKIPEQSLMSVAMSSADIASVDGADASYYNPANMSLMSPEQVMELGMTYIDLPRVKYNDDTVSARNGESKGEKFFIPTLHYVGPKFNDWRFGLSFVAPAGLSKRWDSSYQKAFAEEFTLKVTELNPTASYKVSDKLALGLGLRAIHSEGIVKSSGVIAAGPISASRDLTGSSVDYGYNVAITYKPINDIALAATYRSKVDLTINGNATLTSSLGGSYGGGATVTVPLPATLDLAASYKFDKTTVEFVYERTYWSAYKELDFNYQSSFSVDPGNVMKAAFDNPKAKNWKDSDTYRLGVKHRLNDKLDLMAGFAIDKTPVPDETIGFELPDSNAKVYSCGAAYKITDKTTLGFGYLYSNREDRSASNTTVKGTVSGSDAYLARFSVITKF